MKRNGAARSPEATRAANAAKARRWRAANPKAAREAARRRRAANPEAARQANHRWYAANRGAARDTNRRWYAANPEAARAAARRRYAANPEAEREASRRWRAAHPEAKRESERRWLASHPETKRALHQRRRARLAGVPTTLSTGQWEAIKAQYKGRCAYCGKKPKVLTQDHLVPISKNGAHALGNVVPACRSCNSKKGTKAPPKPVQPLLV